MSNIMKFLSAFCITSVLLGILCVFIPKGSMSKTVKYGFSVCFLVLIFSFFGMLANISFETKSLNTAAPKSDYSETAAKAVFQKALTEAGIIFEDIELITSKNESGGIDIIEVSVTSTDDPRKIKETIGNDEYYKVSVVGE